MIRTRQVPLGSGHWLNQALRRSDFVRRISLIQPTESADTLSALLADEGALPFCLVEAYPWVFFSQAFIHAIGGPRNRVRGCSDHGTIWISSDGNRTTGILVVSAEQSSILGLQTRNLGENGRAVIITIDAPSFVPGKRLYDRVQWCLAESRTTKVHMYLTADDHAALITRLREVPGVSVLTSIRSTVQDSIDDQGRECFRLWFSELMAQVDNTSTETVGELAVTSAAGLFPVQFCEMALTRLRSQSGWAGVFLIYQLPTSSRTTRLATLLVFQKGTDKVHLIDIHE